MFFVTDNTIIWYSFGLYSSVDLFSRLGNVDLFLLLGDLVLSYLVCRPGWLVDTSILSSVPPITKLWSNAGLMLAHRLQRWLNIETTTVQHSVTWLADFGWIPLVGRYSSLRGRVCKALGWLNCLQSCKHHAYRHSNGGGSPCVRQALPYRSALDSPPNRSRVNPTPKLSQLQKTSTHRLWYITATG